MQGWKLSRDVLECYKDQKETRKWNCLLTIMKTSVTNDVMSFIPLSWYLGYEIRNYDVQPATAHTAYQSRCEYDLPLLCNHHQRPRDELKNRNADERTFRSKSIGNLIACDGEGDFISSRNRKIIIMELMYFPSAYDSNEISIDEKSRIFSEVSEKLPNHKSVILKQNRK